MVSPYLQEQKFIVSFRRSALRAISPSSTIVEIHSLFQTGKGGVRYAIIYNSRNSQSLLDNGRGCAISYPIYNSRNLQSLLDLVLFMANYINLQQQKFIVSFRLLLARRYMPQSTIVEIYSLFQTRHYYVDVQPIYNSRNLQSLLDVVSFLRCLDHLQQQKFIVSFRRSNGRAVSARSTIVEIHSLFQTLKTSMNSTFIYNSRNSQSLLDIVANYAELWIYNSRNSQSLLDLITGKGTNYFLIIKDLPLCFFTLTRGGITLFISHFRDNTIKIKEIRKKAQKCTD